MKWNVNEYYKYAAFIRETERRYALPENLLARVLYQDSRYDAATIAGHKRNPTGALGIAQCMPDAAVQFGLKLVNSSHQGEPTRTYDPFDSINAAGQCLHQYRFLFNSWHLAIVAYNWGAENARKWIRCETTVVNGKEVSYQIPQVTREYVEKITADIPC